jgi:hypothetical protein
MSKLKLMSVLQSRLSRRSYLITRMGEFAATRAMKAQYKRFIVEQKQDKQILKQLIVDERELKELREIKYLMYSEY